MDSHKQTSLSSPWAEGFDPESPLPDYPRPSLVREEWLGLNGYWDYCIKADGSEAAVAEGRIVVPYPIESPLSGVGRALGPEEVLTYRRRVDLPAAWKGRSVILHVGACDWEAKAFVDDVYAGGHRGGYSPFSLDITELIHEGSCEIRIEARDPTDAGSQCRGKQSRKPGGIWYTPASGIWGSVWLEPVQGSHIARITSLPDPGGGRFLVTALVMAADGEPSLRLMARLKENGRVVSEVEVQVPRPSGPSRAGLQGGEAEGLGLKATRKIGFELPVPEPRLWSPDSPFLYGLELELEGGDRAESYAAMRSVAVMADASGQPRIFLNGKAIFNIAVLDQGYWPEGIYTAPSDEALLGDIRAAKGFGFNTIRKHAKVECERWYWHCDREGVLVWQDIPSGGGPMDFLHSAILGFAGLRLRDDRRLARFGRADADGREGFEREAAEIVDFLKGFACIAVWVVFNEGWGQFESERVSATIAGLDPSRLVDAVSGWYDRGAGHFASRHDYTRKPRLPSARRGRIAAISEFGGLTYKAEGHSTDDKRQFGYRKVADGEELTRRYEALVGVHFAALAKQGLAAAVYTQITDVETERNGLLSYDRRLSKARQERIRAANMALVEAADDAAQGTAR